MNVFASVHPKGAGGTGGGGAGGAHRWGRSRKRGPGIRSLRVSLAGPLEGRAASCHSPKTRRFGSRGSGGKSPVGIFEQQGPEGAVTRGLSVHANSVRTPHVGGTRTLPSARGSDGITDGELRCPRAEFALVHEPVKTVASWQLEASR